MLSLGLAATPWQAYLDGLNRGYDMKLVVMVTDLEHRVINDISHMVMEGGTITAEEVKPDPDGADDDGSASVGVQASCSFDICDPTRSLGLDSRSPADGAIYLDRMVKVVVSVLDPVSGWVDCPVFCGPISKYDRDGVFASVEAQSKEWLLLDQADQKASYSGKKTDVVRKIATDYGEDPARIDIPNLAEKVPEKVSFGRDTLPWNRLFYLVRTLGQTPFYDGRGVLRFMPDSGTPVLTLRGDAITTDVQIGYDTNDLRNGVRVIGKKASIDTSGYLEATNPNSRQALGRRGKFRTRMEKVQDSDIRSTPSAKTVRDRTLKRLGATVVRPTFDCNPVRPLEIGDTVNLDLPDYSGQARVTSYTKPLDATSQMQFGYSMPVLKPTTTSIRRP